MTAKFLKSGTTLQFPAQQSQHNLYVIYNVRKQNSIKSMRERGTTLCRSWLLLLLLLLLTSLIVHTVYAREYQTSSNNYTQVCTNPRVMWSNDGVARSHLLWQTIDYCS